LCKLQSVPRGRSLRLESALVGSTCGARAAALVVVLSALVARSTPAWADDPPAQAPRAPPLIRSGSPKRSAWQTFRAGSDLIDSVPTAAVIDGSWSIALHVNTELTNRTWDAPYPWGTIGQYSTRLLYGLGWTLMLSAESVAVVLAHGGNFDWLAEASYRSDWAVPIDLPACPRVGAFGGCGMGIGSFAFVQLRPRGSRIWYEAGGGWIQQRVLNDDLRTVAESSWVLSPIIATWDLHTDLAAPVAFRTFVGPGLFFGMHNAHMHPTLRGAARCTRSTPGSVPAGESRAD
jgi:hypothetical protein